MPKPNLNQVERHFCRAAAARAIWSRLMQGSMQRSPHSSRTQPSVHGSSTSCSTSLLSSARRPVELSSRVSHARGERRKLSTDEVGWDLGAVPSLFPFIMQDGREWIGTGDHASISHPADAPSEVVRSLGNAASGILALLQERRAGKRAAKEDAPPGPGTVLGVPFRKRFRCAPPSPCEGEGVSHNGCAVPM